MAKVVSSVGLRDLVVDEKSSAGGKKVVVAKDSAFITKNKSTVRTVVCRPAVATGALYSSSNFPFRLDTNSMGIANNVCLRFQVTENGTGSCYLNPAHYWFSYIELWSLSNDRMLFRLYPEKIQADLASMDYQFREKWAPLVGYQKDNYWFNDRILPQGASRYVYLPLPNYISDDCEQLDLTELKHGLELRFYPIAGGPVASGTGIINLNEVALMAEENTLTDSERREHKDLLYRAIHEEVYIDVQQVTTTATPYTASTTYSFPLDQLQHKSIALLFCLRSVRSGTSSNALRYIDLGPDTQIDLLTNSGSSWFSNGTPVRESYLRKISGSKLYSSGFSNDNALYCIPFSENMHRALSGDASTGTYEFKGEKEQLQITTMGAGTNTIITFTPDANATGGSYYIAYKGVRSAAIAYNATAATIKSTVEAISSVRRQGIQVSVNQNLNAGAMQMTITDKAGCAVESADVDFFDIDQGSLATTALVGVAVSQQGQRGFLAGTYVVDIFSLYLKRFRIKDARIGDIENL